MNLFVTGKCFRGSVPQATPKQLLPEPQTQVGEVVDWL